MGFEFNLDDDGAIMRPRLLPLAADVHKYARGHAIVISGPALRTGASRLAAQAALALGAGLVTIVGERASLKEHAAHVTAVMLREHDPDFSYIDDRVRAILVGPGAGTGAATTDIVLKLLSFQLPVVLDADALTSFADDPSDLFAALHSNVVLTPHRGEFARLFPDIAVDDSVSAARTASQRSGAIVLLKGAQTVIASSNGMFAINRHASPWLATAGSGDILAGLICGLLAQGQDPFEAAAIAAWLHGDVGMRFGPGLTADVMLGQIPAVLKECFKN